MGIIPSFWNIRNTGAAKPWTNCTAEWAHPQGLDCVLDQWIDLEAIFWHVRKQP